MPKQRRLPACEPCRTSKLACDHAQPVCARCLAKDQSAQCIYRDAPFKKAKRHPPPPASPDHSPTVSANTPFRPPLAPTHNNTADASPAGSSLGLLPRHRLYPNPGYLGSSSHTALFGLMEPEETIGASRTVSEAHISHGAQLIDQLCTSADVPACLELVDAWLKTGANLSVAAPFTARSLATARVLLATDREVAATISGGLFAQSCRPLLAGPDTSAETFGEQFSGIRARWETVGLFLIALSRATMSPRHSSGDTIRSEAQRRHVRRLAMHFADRCLEICLSLDSLNDLQLVLVIENFILHTLVDGDQSFESWRKLGDLSSSIFALGYHQDILGPSAVPPFLLSIRQAAFAYSYSADKNISLFLGRPPRILKNFCRLRQPGLESYFSADWDPDTPLDFYADVRWAALCARLKEDIMVELIGSEHRPADGAGRASEIQSKAEMQWSLLPSHFRLEAPMKSYDCQPAELDIMLGFRLNQLHVLFLLRLALVKRVSDPDPDLVALAQTMLSLVIEALVFKDRLVHSGTSLSWKVVYYGLAAAGVICLSLLEQLPSLESPANSNVQTLRDLSVLVVEVERGSLVYDQDANYALLAGATRTIKNILDTLFNARPSAHEMTTEAALQQQLEIPSIESWDPWTSNNIQDFEANFWLTLAEHPSLMANPQDDLPPY